MSPVKFAINNNENNKSNVNNDSDRLQSIIKSAENIFSVKCQNLQMMIKVNIL